MRNFQNVKQAHSEIRRDLRSFGVLHETKTMQNKCIEDNPNFYTKELTNYGYIIQRVNSIEDFIGIPGFHEKYCLAEISDRETGIIGTPVNPGRSWMQRPEIWSEFLDDRGKFDYTYSERLDQFLNLLVTLSKDPGSRRAWYPIFDFEDTEYAHQDIRVPCSLGYNFQIRDKKLDITYLMRSCDFATHWANDVFMTHCLQSYLLKQLIQKGLDIQMGTFSHFIFSLHIYNKDVAGVF